MPAAAGIRLIDYAADQAIEEKVYQRWLHIGQHMSYQDFKRELTPPVFKPDAEILADTEKILNGGAGHGNI